MKGGISLRRKISDFGGATSLTSICCVYKEKILKTTHTEERSVLIYKFRKLLYTTRIVNKSNKFQTNHSKITNNSHRFFRGFFLFRGFLAMKDDIFIFSRNVRKSNASENYFKKKSKILWNINYIRMRRKIIDDYCLKYLNDLFGIKLIILRFELLQLSEFAWTLGSSV